MVSGATAEYIALAEKYGYTPTAMALAWARDRWYNAVIVTGTTTVEQCDVCIEALKLPPLPKELNDEIDLVHEKYRNPIAALANKVALSSLQPPSMCVQSACL